MAVADYTNVDKHELLIEVAKHDGSGSKASRSTGVPQRTLQRWWDGLTEDKRQEYLSEARKRQEGYWQAIHDACLQVAREKVSEMSARDALVGAGISFDKLQLIRGQATGISATVPADAESLARSVEEILQKASRDAIRATRSAPTEQPAE